MKTLEEIVETIKDLKEEIEKRYKAEIIGVFGSFARGEQKETSDVDILVDFQKDATLIDFTGLSIFLEEKLGTRVDIVPKNSVREELKEKINQEVVKI